jgi:hypothetical protein
MATGPAEQDGANYTANSIFQKNNSSDVKNG